MMTEMRPATYEQKIIFNCRMVDLYTIKVSRGSDGSVDYFVPNKDIILMSIECKDGKIMYMLKDYRFKEAVAEQDSVQIDQAQSE